LPRAADSGPLVAVVLGSSFSPFWFVLSYVVGSCFSCVGLEARLLLAHGGVDPATVAVVDSRMNAVVCCCVAVV